MSSIIYPTVEEIIEYNTFAITLFQVKKSDTAEVLSLSKIRKALELCKNYKGTIYDKAAILLRELIKAHAFASGNRRTAFIATKSFLTKNNGKFKIRNDPNVARVMQGIREDYYKLDEIKEWIKNGKIKEFKR